MTRTVTTRGRWFFILALLLVAAFALPLFNLVRHALHSDTVSHVLLVPFICAYLVRIHRSSRHPDLESPSETPPSPPRPGRGLGEVSTSHILDEISSPPSTIHHPLSCSSTSAFRFPLSAFLSSALGILALAAYFIWGRSGRLGVNDALTLSTLSFYCFFVAIALGTLGWRTLRPYRFALGFMAFMIPLPLFATNGLSVALQYASAEASDITLRLTGMPVYRDGLGFQLPGLRIFVAEECSGIRSTLVLFITSLLAAHLFLRTRWKKFVFVLCVFPIGVFRNALRITSISWLTVNVDSGVIDGPLHHSGGPVFFVLSLVPLFLLLWWFRKSDRRQMKRPSSK